MTAANVPLQPVSYTRRQARRGLALYFAIVVPLTAVFEAILIGTGNPLWVFTLMWVPAAASIVARLVLREGSLTCPSASGDARRGSTSCWR